MTKRVKFHTVRLHILCLKLKLIETGKTGASKMSLRSQVMQAVKEEGDKRDWDPSVKSEKKFTAEDRVAQRLA